MTELRKCPFCGGTAKLWEELFIRFSFLVYCTNCGASVKAKTEQEAIEAWNKRVPQTWTSKAFERIGEVNKTIEVEE